MRVLGIDPGLTRCGYAVLDGSPGRSPCAVTYSVVRTPPDVELGERLLEIFDAIAGLITTYQPEVLAVERVFSQHNVRTVMGTGQAAGVAILAAARAGIQVAMYTPTEVKAAVTGSGNAEKAQVSAMVTRLLSLPEPPRPADVADALALAICHAWRGAALKRRALASTGVLGALPAGPWGSGGSMIAHLTGLVSAVGPDQAVVDIGGVGLAVSCTPSTLATLRTGTPARLATTLVVREDSLTLYGFVDDDERSLFELLQTASGVGPRLAQAVLAIHRPAAIRRAVASSDVVALTQVPGIGKKGAERLLIDLKDRLGAGPETGYGAVPGGAPPDGEAGWRRSLMQALLGLGWNPREAEAALQAVTPEADARIERGDSVEVGALLRQALSSLDRL